MRSEIGSGQEAATMNLRIRNVARVVLVFGALADFFWLERSANAQRPAAGVPTFEVDPFWPKFDGNWIFGSIGGVFVDPANDHVWVLNRPRTLETDENYAVQKPQA